jgi:Putative zinc-finger
MDHNLATRIQAPTRYLLGELSLPEREDFEEHFFTCRECAEELRTGVMFAANARAVFRDQQHRPTPVIPAARQPDAGFWAWLRPSFQPALTAAFAIALVAVMVHDRGMISSLRNQVAQYSEESSIIPAYVIHSAERGNGQSITVPKTVSSFNVTFDIPPADPADKDVPLVAQIDDSTGNTRSTIRLPSGESATLRLPVSKYPAGSYTLILRPASPDAKEINRYRFSLAYE